MRMWRIRPRWMCRKHLLGEHLEMHMFEGSLLRGISLDGYIKKGLVEVHNIVDRHDELVYEMLARGYKHNSPLKNTNALKFGVRGEIDLDRSLRELCHRCPECFDRFKRLR